MKRIGFALAAWAMSASVTFAQAPAAEQAFNPATWPKQIFLPAAEGLGFNQGRKAQVRDLVDSGRLLGMSKGDVTDLLGPAEETDETLTFVLGDTPIGDFNPTTLVVRFDYSEVATGAFTDQMVLAHPFAAEAFDAARWPKAQPVSHAPRTPGSNHWLTVVDPTRMDMAEDIAANDRLKGLPQAQVEAMLGDASVQDTGGAVVLAYDLAPSLYLLVRFEQGRATRAGVLRQ